MKIIGISGKIKSGKDVFASELIKLYKQDNKVCRRVYFADALKLSCMYVFGLTKQDVYTQEGKKKVLPHLGGITVREILQKFGTEVCRNVYEDIWVWKTIEKLHRLEQDCACVVIPDLRFKNELKALKNMKAQLIRLNRPNYGDKFVHISETDLDEITTWDHVYDNNSVDAVKASAGHFYRCIE